MLDAIRRVRVGFAIGLVDREERGLILLGLLLEEQPLPPRVVHGDHARAARLRAIVDRAHRRQGLAPGKQPHAAHRPVPADERRPAALEVDLAEEGRESVAEAAVDAALGRVQHRDRLAARVDVVQLRAHERRVDPAAPMRRLHADGGHARPRHLGAARHREAVARGRRSPDDPAVVERRVPPVQLEHQSFADHVLGGDGAAERQLERTQTLLELVVGDRADLHVHADEPIAHLARSAEALERVGHHGGRPAPTAATRSIPCAAPRPRAVPRPTGASRSRTPACGAPGARRRCGPRRSWCQRRTRLTRRAPRAADTAASDPSARGPARSACRSTCPTTTAGCATRIRRAEPVRALGPDRVERLRRGLDRS